MHNGISINKNKYIKYTVLSKKDIQNVVYFLNTNI